jgi:hypothetical protein
MLKWKLISVRLETVVILIHDMCMVFTERTMGSMEFLDDVGHVESRLDLFGDNVSVNTG